MSRVHFEKFETGFACSNCRFDELSLNHFYLGDAQFLRNSRIFRKWNRARPDNIPAAFTVRQILFVMPVSNLPWIFGRGFASGMCNLNCRNCAPMFNEFSYLFELLDVLVFVYS